MAAEDLTAYQLIQRVLRCVEELERLNVLSHTETLIVRSTVLQARSRLLRTITGWPGLPPERAATPRNSKGVRGRSGPGFDRLSRLNPGTMGLPDLSHQL